MRAAGVPVRWRPLALAVAVVALIADSLAAAGPAHAADPDTLKYCVYASAAPGDCTSNFANLPLALNAAMADEAANGTWAEIAVGPGTWPVLSTLPFGYVAAAGAHTDIHGAGIGVTTLNGIYDPGNTNAFSMLSVTGDSSTDTSIHDLSFEVNSTGSLNHATGLEVSHAYVHDVDFILRSHDDADELATDPLPRGTIGMRAHDDVTLSHAHISIVFTAHKNDLDEYVGAFGVGTGVRADGTGVAIDHLVVEWDNQSGGPQLVRNPIGDQPTVVGVDVAGGTASIANATILGLPYGITHEKGSLSLTDSLIEVPSETGVHTAGIVSATASDADFLTLSLDGDTIVRTFPLPASQGGSLGLHLVQSDATIKNSLIEVGQPGTDSPYGQSILCGSKSSVTMSHSVYTSIRIYPGVGCDNVQVSDHNRLDYTQPVADWPNHDWTPTGWSWLANGGDPTTVAGARTDALGRLRIVHGRVDIGAFECQSGCVSLAEPSVVPGKPPSAKATKVNGGLTISWGPASDGGTDLTSYVVKVGSKTKTVAGSTHSATITGFTLGKSVTWSVRAANAVGQGPAATGSAVVIGLPSAPTSLSLTQKSGGKLLVTWHAPSTSSAHPRTGFKVYVDGVLKKTATGTSATLTGLVKGHTYAIKVVAYNAAGNSSSLAKSYHRTIT